VFSGRSGGPTRQRTRTVARAFGWGRIDRVWIDRLMEPRLGVSSCASWWCGGIQSSQQQEQRSSRPAKYTTITSSISVDPSYRPNPPNTQHNHQARQCPTEAGAAADGAAVEEAVVAEAAGGAIGVVVVVVEVEEAAAAGGAEGAEGK
jgi:hypothetical protein